MEPTERSLKEIIESYCEYVTTKSLNDIDDCDSKLFREELIQRERETLKELRLVLENTYKGEDFNEENKRHHSKGV